MWEATVNGRKLNFHLAGINNQNFIMQDEETGSWWQQVTGEAIQGPLKGSRLKAVFHDELTFSMWKHERPAGQVLRPDDSAPWKEFSEDWETKTARMPVVTRAAPDDPLQPRDLVIGLKVNGAAKAYPLAALQAQNPIVDTLGGVPIVIVLGDDRASVRAFERQVDGRALELFMKAGVAPQLVDAETGSAWDFTGRSQAGPLAGRQLQKIPLLKDYWFDWKLYNPQTAVYRLGTR